MRIDPAVHPEASATEALWRRFRGRLLAYLRTRVPTEADADDVLQEIFLRIHETTSRPHDGAEPGPWLYGIARRAVADFYRSRSRRLPASSLDALPPGSDAHRAAAAYEAPPENLSPYLGEHDVHEEVLSWLVPLIDALPEAYRVPLRMADVEERSQQQIADALGLSLSGAKSRVQRGRAQLGELLQECCLVEFSPAGRAVAFHRRQAQPTPCEDAACAEQSLTDAEDRLTAQ